MASDTGAPEPELDWNEYNKRWDGMWDKGLEPGQAFDAGTAAPALVNLLENLKLVSVEGKRVLVPGCGRGYDLPVFASNGASEVVGLELAPTAASSAEAWLDRQCGEGQRGVCKVQQGDFFKFQDAGGAFDVGYDYTFLCALHPSMRTAWAAAWANHLAPHGRLITLLFPVGKSEESGPPWPVSPELYRNLLEPVGFEWQYLEAVADELSHPGRGGQEWLGVWLNSGGKE